MLFALRVLLHLLWCCVDRSALLVRVHCWGHLLEQAGVGSARVLLVSLVLMWSFLCRQKDIIACRFLNLVSWYGSNFVHCILGGALILLILILRWLKGCVQGERKVFAHVCLIELRCHEETRLVVAGVFVLAIWLWLKGFYDDRWLPDQARSSVFVVLPLVL